MIALHHAVSTIARFWHRPRTAFFPFLLGTSLMNLSWDQGERLGLLSLASPLLLGLSAGYASHALAGTSRRFGGRPVMPTLPMRPRARALAEGVAALLPILAGFALWPALGTIALLAFGSGDFGPIIVEPLRRTLPWLVLVWSAYVVGALETSARGRFVAVAGLVVVGLVARETAGVAQLAVLSLALAAPFLAGEGGVDRTTKVLFVPAFRGIPSRPALPGARQVWTDLAGSVGPTVVWTGLLLGLGFGPLALFWRGELAEQAPLVGVPFFFAFFAAVAIQPLGRSAGGTAPAHASPLRSLPVPRRQWAVAFAAHATLWCLGPALLAGIGASLAPADGLLAPMLRTLALSLTTAWPAIVGFDVARIEPAGMYTRGTAVAGIVLMMLVSASIGGLLVVVVHDRVVPVAPFAVLFVATSAFGWWVTRGVRAPVGWQPA